MSFLAILNLRWGMATKFDSTIMFGEGINPLGQLF
jgi:hypothetical protein